MSITKKLTGMSELDTEKKLAQNKTSIDFTAGEKFIEESTGSATMINLDGKSDL